MKGVRTPLDDAGWPSIPDGAEPLSVATIPFALSVEECARLRPLLEDGSRIGALAGGRATQAVRDCTIKWLDDNAETDWLFRRIAQLVADVNRSHFDFALEGLFEGVQLIRYGVGQVAYDWHIDIGRSGTTRSRKLSLSIQLSDESAYQGGALELNPAGDIWCAPKTQGTAIVFPSYMLHRVAPVTQGQRFALVAWIHGPAFR